MDISAHGRVPRIAALSATALALVLGATAVAAQQYGSDQDQSSGPPEEVIVVAPNYHPAIDPVGRPDERTNLSEQVRYDDLDLSTSAGAHALRARIRDTALDVCGQLAYRFPVAAVDQPSCYRTAVEQAMNRADVAIHQARSYGYEE